jgi:K+-transporting ATPase ATPase A chain
VGGRHSGDSLRPVADFTRRGTVLLLAGFHSNFKPYEVIQTLEEFHRRSDKGLWLPSLPSDVGTNGGGFFNANSAHPYENPTPLSNLIQMLLIFCLPAGLTYMFGKMVKDTRQGWALFGAMSVMFWRGLS